MQRCDVLVVGAGLAGLWTARLLARAGLRVMLVDERPAVDRRIRTTGIFVRRTLEDFSLPLDCFGPPIHDVTLYSPAFRALHLASPHPEFRVARMGPLYRRLLAAARGAGVAWRPRTRATDLERHGATSVVRLQGVRVENVETRFVVGGDGAQSRVARWLGLSRNREWIVGVEEMYRGVPLTGRAAFHCILSPALAPGYLAWLVHDGEEVHLGVGGYARHFDPGAALMELRMKLPVALDWTRARLVDRRGGRIPVGGVLPRLVCSHGLLVGDAAGAVSPLTAGGLDPCLRLSELGAKVALDYLSSGDPRTLSPYDGARFRRHFRNRLLLRTLIARIRHPLLLETACRALGHPPLKTMAQRIFFGRGSFPDVDRFPLPDPVDWDGISGFDPTADDRSLVSRSDTPASREIA
jgi:flavin-dependent dehydrogenase